MAPYLGKKKRPIRAKKHRKPKKIRKPKRPRKPKKVRKPKKPRKPRYYRLARQPKAPKAPRFPVPIRAPKVKKPRIRKRRTRSRVTTLKFVGYRHSTGAFLYEDIYPNEPYDTLNDWTIKPGDMSRRSYGEVSAGIIRIDLGNDIRTILESGSHMAPSFNPDLTSYVWTPYVNQLRWKKLPTSNEADLMTAFAELDDTIAMLGKNIVKSASYGGYKWGWSPLISDIMAVNDCGNRVKESYLDGNRRSSPYRSKHVIRKNSPIIPHRGGKIRHEWEVTVTMNGVVTYENDVLAFYDYMGFHPSPKLVWDLLPLSFAVDYVLPIGDMLKSITPSKGWTKAANFTGWLVIRAVCKEVMVEYPFVSGRRLLYEMTYPDSLFVTRTFVNNYALEQKIIPASIDPFKVPTWQQAFDLAYLSEAFYNRGRKLLSPHVYRKKKR